MSSIIAAIYLWLFSLGWVSNHFWLAAIAIGLVITAACIFRNYGAAGIALLATAGTVMVIASTIWPLRIAGWADPFSTLRAQVAKSIFGFSRETAALVLGMTIGDDSLVSPQLREAMQATSLTHLMAVSGANCAIVIGAVYFLLARFGQRSRVIISLLALVIYVGIVGLQPSVLRAAVMAIVVMGAMASGSRVKPLASLALCIIVLLALEPGLAISFGFTLSVLATAGILLLAPHLYQRFSKRLPRWIAMGLAVSAGAQLFCLPVLLGLQGGIPTYALLANLICEPLVAPITIIGLLGVCLIWWPMASGALFWLASIMAWPIAFTANTLSGLPFANLPWPIDATGILGAVILVGAIWLALVTKKVLVRNLAWLVVAGLVACSIGVVINRAVKISIWPMRNWQVASCDVGQGDATVIRDGEAVAVIDVGRDDKLIDSCLSRLGVSHIDLLVLTHFDADHVNGLTGAITGRTIGRALLTSFQDDRPGATYSRTVLESHQVAVTIAERGLSGSLNNTAWKVLSPSRTATEVEDSNDGSVTMLWRFSSFQLIALADLGEKGQQRLASELGTWWTDSSLPLVMKVSHHGSADQYAELLEWLKPSLALISVGADNGYGHPTRRTLNTLAKTGSVILRTDLLGSVALSNQTGEFELSYSGSS